LRWFGDQIAQDVDDDDADDQCDQHLPGSDAERKQTAREHISADAVHV
jgi:hypothetical protein